jgi:hypothetical protein
MEHFEDYASFPPEDLHYIYGVNCYQHAIGYPNPIFYRCECDGEEFVYYVKLQPGSISNLDMPRTATTKEYSNRIIANCEEDGLIFCGDRCVVREGYRTLAFYTDTFCEQDFHFAFLNDKGLWETKCPWIAPRAFKDVRAAGLGQFQLRGYLLAPDGFLPKAISEWVPKSVGIITSSNRVILLDKVPEIEAHCAPTLVFRPKHAACYLTKYNAVFPGPLWPPTDLAILRKTLDPLTATVA